MIGKETAALLSRLERQAGQRPGRVREVMELRLILEPEVAALAALRRSPEDLERIRRILEKQRRAGPAEFPALDTRFHMALAKATGNEVLWEVAAMLHDLLAESRDEALMSPQRIAASLEAHARIVQGLEAVDPESSARAMREHLQGVEGSAVAPQAFG
ncbi:FadR/GntR family transcriptional regulator [Fundidesulfovibrio soli]|uniref:FadR/GntR family transcriptional regulator n=1 Tax=Fundidesulfovibrio soli TaxID=2922716 RepID=UPI001FAEEBED|nr:FCD domain-containing protein [Fundidesulfovibrio soli]